MSKEAWQGTGRNPGTWLVPPSPGDGSEPVQLSSGELCPLSPAGGSHFPVALGGLQAGTS